MRTSLITTMLLLLLLSPAALAETWDGMGFKLNIPQGWVKKGMGLEHTTHKSWKFDINVTKPPSTAQLEKAGYKVGKLKVKGRQCFQTRRTFRGRVETCLYIPFKDNSQHYMLRTISDSGSNRKAMKAADELLAGLTLEK